MRHLIKLFIMILFASSSGASDEPTQYVYAVYDHNDALKYTISKGDMDSSGCFFSQMVFFSKEAQNAMKNNLTIDFMNSDFTPTSIDLYKNKIYWVDLDLNTKIKNNFVKLDEEVPEFELIHQDDELIFRIKTPHKGSTLVCDFPFRELLLVDIFPNENREWKKISTNKNKDDLFIDLNTILKRDEYVYYWELVDLNSPLEVIVLSIASPVQVDCVKEGRRSTILYLYDQSMGEGNMLQTIDLPDTTWQYPTPGSVHLKFIKYACDY